MLIKTYIRDVLNMLLYKFFEDYDREARHKSIDYKKKGVRNIKYAT